MPELAKKQITEQAEPLKPAAVIFLADKYEKTLRLDVAKLKPEQIQDFFSYFLENFSDFDADFQMQAVEQYLNYEVGEIELLKKVLDSWSKQQKTQMAEYLVKVMDPQKIYPLFHHLYRDLDPEKQAEYFDFFTEKEPANAIMVAPFGKTISKLYTAGGIPRSQPFSYETDLTKIIIKQDISTKDENGKDTINRQEKNLLAMYFDNFQAMSKAFNSVLEYGDNQIIKKYVEFIFKNARNGGVNFLVPYFEQLVAKGILTIKEIKEILSSDTYDVSSFYLTPEEEKVSQQISKRWENNDLKWFEEVEMRKIGNLGEKRDLDHLFGGYQYLKRILSRAELSAYLYKLIDDGLPLFEKISEFGEDKIFTQTVIRDAQWNYNFLQDYDDLKKFVEAGYAKEAFALICRKLTNNEYQANLIVFLDKFIEAFPGDYQIKLLNLLKKNNPNYLLMRPDVCRKYQIELKELVERRPMDSWEYIWQYNRIVYNLRKSLPENEFFAYKQEYDRQVRKIFETDPITLLDYSHIAIQVLGLAEYKDFIAQRIRDKDAKFIGRCVSISKNEKEKISGISVDDLLKQVAKILQADDSIFCDVINSPYFHRHTILDLQEILGEKVFFKKFFANLEKIDFDEYVSDGAFRDSLIRNQKYAGLFLRHLDKLGKGELLMEFIDNLNYLADKPKRRSRIQREDAQITPEEVEQAKIAENISEQAELILLKLEPEQLFNRDLKNLKSDEVIRTKLDQSAEEYFQLNPGELVNLCDLCPKYLSSEVYESCLKNSLQFLAFDQEAFVQIINQYSFYDKLPEELLEQLIKLNPLLSISQESRAHGSDKLLREDFYQLAIKSLEEKPLFPKYKGKLTKLAENITLRQGEQYKVNNLHYDEEFFSLANRISLAEACPLLKSEENLEFINNLSADQSEEIYKLVEVLFIYGLDKQFSGVKLTANNLEQVKTNFAKAFLQYLGQVLNLDLSKVDFSQARVDFSTINPMTKYYNHTCRKNPEMQKQFEQMAVAVFNNNYANFRLSNQPETGELDQNKVLKSLKAEKLMPEKLRSEQFAAWQEEDSIQLEALLDYSIEDFKIEVRKILEQAVADSHLEEAHVPENYFTALDAYQRTFKPLEKDSKRQKELLAIFEQIKKKQQSVSPEEKESLSQEFKQVKANIAEFMSEYKFMIEKAEADLYLSRFMNLSVQELKDEAIIIEKKPVAFKKALDKIRQYHQHWRPEFMADLDRISSAVASFKKKLFGDGNLSRTQLTVTDKVDFNTHFKIGDVPVKTCQNYDSSGFMNKGLLSYVVDPNLKILQIYDENGSFIARSILRLLEDGEGRPQLFLERIYSVNPHRLIEKAIIKFAKQKAEKMGVSLFSHESETEIDLSQEMQIVDLYSQHSRNAFVYTDAGGGLRSKGVYRVNGAFSI